MSIKCIKNQNGFLYLQSNKMMITTNSSVGLSIGPIVERHHETCQRNKSLIETFKWPHGCF